MNLKPDGKPASGDSSKPDGAKAGNAGNGVFESANSRTHETAKSQSLEFWTALDILANRWHWLAIGGIVLAGAFFYLGSNLIKDKWTASAQLMRNNIPEPFKATPTSPETFSAL